MRATVHHRHLHTEQHFGAGVIVRDIVIGMSDELTVRFALADGWSTWEHIVHNLAGCPN